MNDTINAIILDDEQGCIDNLKHYLSVYCPRIRIAGSANTAQQAEHCLAEHSVDLAFFDIQLLDRNIFETIPALERMPVTKVFVTAYSQYTLQALRTSALDYLLKPLEAQEIRRCYQRITEHFDARRTVRDTSVQNTTARESKSVTLRHGDHIYQVLHEDLIMLKASGFYTEVHFRDNGQLKQVLLCKPISTLAASWADAALQRVHRSYAINPRQITSIRKQGANLMISLGDSGMVPVAKRRIADFLDYDKHNARD